MADEKGTCKISVATIALPDNSDGLLHWRTGNTATTPLQLSKRYFSKHLEIPGNTIQFFNEPVLAETPQETLPKPLITLNIPTGQKLIYIVLSAYTDENDQTKWRGDMLNTKDWKVGSMKLFNACSEPLGITAGNRKIQLSHGKSVDFHAAEWKGEAFPVKIFRLHPEVKTIFSSSWRVAPGRRELCYVGNSNNSLILRSLIDLEAVPSETALEP